MRAIAFVGSKFGVSSTWSFTPHMELVYGRVRVQCGHDFLATQIRFKRERGKRERSLLAGSRASWCHAHSWSPRRASAGGGIGPSSSLARWWRLEEGERRRAPWRRAAQPRPGGWRRWASLPPTRRSGSGCRTASTAHLMAILSASPVARLLRWMMAKAPSARPGSLRQRSSWLWQTGGKRRDGGEDEQLEWIWPVTPRGDGDSWFWVEKSFHLYDLCWKE